MPALERLRMSWEDYLNLPEQPKAEWVDGEVVIVNVPPVPDHGTAVIKLGAVLLAFFPDDQVMTEVPLMLPRNRLRRPDLMVVAERQHSRWVSDPPLLCAEVLSPSTRSEDLVRKSREYAEAGVGQYWVVDPDDRTIEVMRNTDGDWGVSALLDDDHPEAEIELAGLVVPLDLRRILRG